MVQYQRIRSYYSRLASLKCSVCIRFERGRRDFNPAFIAGSTNLRASSFKDHAATDMHVHAKLLYKKKSLSSSIVDYSPIDKALSTLDAKS